MPLRSQLLLNTVLYTLHLDILVELDCLLVVVVLQLSDKVLVLLDQSATQQKYLSPYKLRIFFCS